MDIVDACMILEGAQPITHDGEDVEALQLLINTGVVWKLQGSYGRLATRAISAGICTLPSPNKKRVTKRG